MLYVIVGIKLNWVISLLLFKHTNKINETEQEANNSTWYLYDDMKKILELLKTLQKFLKMNGHMLFYRLVSNHEVSGASSINSDNNTNNNNNNNT